MGSTVYTALTYAVVEVKAEIAEAHKVLISLVEALFWPPILETNILIARK